MSGRYPGRGDFGGLVRMTQPTPMGLELPCVTGNENSYCYFEDSIRVIDDETSVGRQSSLYTFVLYCGSAIYVPSEE